MQVPPVAATDAVAVGVSVVSTLVVTALLGAALYVLRAARAVRREAAALAEEAGRLLGELDRAVGQAGSQIERVDRMVGSAEAISDAVGSASRLVGGVVAEPLIKLVALGSGLARGARVARDGAGLRQERAALQPGSRGRTAPEQQLPAPGDHGRRSLRRGRP